MLTLVAAGGALAFAGFTTFSGKSLCSLMACDGGNAGATTAQVAVSTEAHSCPFHDQIAANKAACSADCASKMGCASGCSHENTAAFVTFNASFPVAVPAAFNDAKSVCPSTLVKASSTSCSKSASTGCSSAAKSHTTYAVSNESKSCASSCSKAKSCSEATAAKTIAASNETKSASGCCPLGSMKAQTVAAAEKTQCSKTLAAAHEGCAGAKACDPAECAAKGCDPSQCTKGGSHAAFVTMHAAFPVAIPAAFNDQKQVCPSTLVKASSTCSSKVSDAASAGCPYAAAQIQAASNEAHCPNAKSCDKSSCDPAKCAAKGCDPSNCPKAKAANTEANTTQTEKSEG
jgi:hypothetical protein